MKNNLLIFGLISLLITSCGDQKSTQDIIDSGNLEQIRARKKSLSDSHKQLEQEMALLDSIIGVSEGRKNLPLVTTMKAKSEKFAHYIDLQGDVRTKQNVLIYPEAAGLLQRVYVDNGDVVKKGQLLATIDDGGMNSQLAQMETQLALAKTTYERQSRLWDQKIGSEIQYLQAKSSYQTQESAVAQMRSQLDKFRITAPFSGVIDAVIKDQGTIVAPAGPGSEIFRIINLSEMYIEVAVPESHISTVTEGKEVSVFFPVLNQQIKTKVRQTGNYINPNNRSFVVEIPVPNMDGRIKPNMTAKVMINDYLQENAILIPQSIISENAEGDQYVFAVSDVNDLMEAKAYKNIITTGKTQGDLVEVLSGVTAGISIIEEGARSVKDGQLVQILKK